MCELLKVVPERGLGVMCRAQLFMAHLHNKNIGNSGLPLHGDPSLFNCMYTSWKLPTAAFST
jgi:hypothetical protein